MTHVAKQGASRGKGKPTVQSNIHVGNHYTPWPQETGRGKYLSDIWLLTISGLPEQGAGLEDEGPPEPGCLLLPLHTLSSLSTP
jgi:hypothetical protein